MHASASFSDGFVRFFRSIVEGAEPLVEGDGGTTVVALKVTVVEIVEVITGFGNTRVYCDLDFLETGMTPGRSECRVLQVTSITEQCRCFSCRPRVNKSCGEPSSFRSKRFRQFHFSESCSLFSKFPKYFQTKLVLAQTLE
mgnify:CR=1 FL=1